MEASRELDGSSLLNNLRPPRLEDAGLEDCALPPESIKEAFLKAAAAAGSRAASIFGTSATESDEEEEGSCVNDPRPNHKQPSDALVGISGVDPPPGACGGNKGGGVPEVMTDEVVSGVTAAEGMADKVVDGGPLPSDGGEACVDGLKGEEMGEKGTRQGEDEDEDREGEIPILAEALV